MRIDHVGLDVSDYERSKSFYEQALAPLGVKVLGGLTGDQGERAALSRESHPLRTVLRKA